MEFKTKKRERGSMGFARRMKARRSVQEGSQVYTHRLQFYRVPPTENISLSDFENFAINRLKVLKQIETIGIRHVKGQKEYDDAMKKDLRNLMPIAVKTLNDEEKIEAMRRDHTSHFILRLAYCRSEDLRRWFISQEVDLFRFRFLQESRENITEFLEENNLHYHPISNEEKEDLAVELSKSSYSISVQTVQHMDFYKVPFTEALDLVRQRKVFISKGFAYVPHNDLVSIILSAFRAHLSHSLAVTARAVPTMEEDNRLLPMLSNISKQYLGEEYTAKSKKAGSISIDELDFLARTSFPLCMRQLHSALREQHHLKHWGRQQYGLFLKGIGLSLEQALAFWKSEFLKIMDMDKFQKSHAYNIRHNFGKEGKRVNYTPYSCMGIIMRNHPGPGDFHGCPFKHTDVKLLRQRLESFNINHSGVEQISDLVSRSHYQVACTKYFELTHGLEDCGFSLQHPNQYFDQSREILTGKSEDKKVSQKSSQGSQSFQASYKQTQGTSQALSANVTLDDDDDEMGLTQEQLEELERDAISQMDTTEDGA